MIEIASTIIQLTILWILACELGSRLGEERRKR